MYLGTPYSHPEPMTREIRYLQAADALNTLLQNKIWTYSPIVHCHELAKLFSLPKDAAFWLEYNITMLRGSAGLFVLKLEGWAQSIGLKGEIAYAAEQGKTITYLSPGDVLHAAYIHHSNQDPAKPSAARIR